MHRPDEVRVLLRRATEIDAETAAAAGTGLTDAEVVEAARSAGVSEAAVRQAIAEHRLRPAHEGPADTPAPWVVSRRVPRLAEGQRAEMLSTFRRSAPYRGLGQTTAVESFGETKQVSFDQTFGGPWARLRIGPADADHDVWIYEHHSHADVSGLGWAVPLLALIPSFLAVAAVMVTVEPPDWMGFVAIAVLTALSTLLVRPIRRRILRTRRRQVDEITRQLDALAAPRPALRLDDIVEPDATANVSSSTLDPRLRESVRG